MVTVYRFQSLSFWLWNRRKVIWYHKCGNYVANQRVTLGMSMNQSRPEFSNLQVPMFMDFMLQLSKVNIPHSERPRQNCICHRHSKRNSLCRNDKCICQLENGNNHPASTVLHEKQIAQSSFYVVNAVPDTSKKKGGYKKGASQSTATQGHSATSETKLERSPSVMVS